MPSYIDEAFYEQHYLLGKKSVLPPGQFEYWERQARMFVDLYTFDRIKNNREYIDEYYEEIGGCLCELAEHLYSNEGSYNKRSESVSGRSVRYIQGIEYRICQKHLFGTGLMYRGGG